MEQTGFDGIAFADTLQDFNTLHYAGQIVHILCCDGSMGFTFQDTRYNISVNDYVILPNAELGSGFSASNDFRGILMSLSEQLRHHRASVSPAESRNETLCP